MKRKFHTGTDLRHFFVCLFVFVSPQLSYSLSVIICHFFITAHPFIFHSIYMHHLFNINTPFILSRSTQRVLFFSYVRISVSAHQGYHRSIGLGSPMCVEMEIRKFASILKHALALARDVIRVASRPNSGASNNITYLVLLS